VRICIVVGTRPEIVKMAPVITALREKGMPYTLVHTGQHYDLEMSEIFIQELGVDRPEVSLEVGSDSQAKQTAEAMVGLERAFETERPSIVLVEGDTNTVLATSLTSVKLGIDVGHVEAGLRSHDLRMPEEHNRRLTDHLSSYLFAPTEASEDNLRRESVWGRIFVTGNTVIDSCLAYMPVAERRSKVLEELRFDEYCLATAHRAENVDDPDTLAEFVRTFTSCPVPVVYPIHPRTEDRLRKFGLYTRLVRSRNVQIMGPKGYFDFLLLMRHSLFILTDSGGIQEEATAPNVRKKVFVLRRSTERPEAIHAGYAELVGTRARRAISRIQEYVQDPQPPTAPSPYGDGRSGERIVGIIRDALEGASSPLSQGRGD
jgi:UDP-N-acetylglucosamine 2-epimerase (non-hydrolysing)